MPPLPIDNKSISVPVVLIKLTQKTVNGNIDIKPNKTLLIKFNLSVKFFEELEKNRIIPK